MLRGRELKKQGKTPQEINTIREQDVKAGKWKMPSVPTTLYVFSAQAEQYDVTSGEVKQGSLRYVVYIPYATSESTGLSLKPELADGCWHPPGPHYDQSLPTDELATTGIVPDQL